MRMLVIAWAVMMAAATFVISSPWVFAQGQTYFVDPRGDDRRPGTSRKSPFRTIQRALDAAVSGDEVVIAPGQYWEDVRTVRDGRPEARITITGTGGAVLRGNGRGRMLEVNHSYITLSGFVIDGKAGNAETAESYRDKLLYVMGSRAEQGVTGVRIIDMTFRHAGGECLRLKYFAHRNEVARSRFVDCGVWDFRFAQGGKNGEAVYIGTAPEQLDRNPTSVSDASNHNWVHHNFFDTRGNECVDIKEGASFNLIEHNECTGQRDPEAAGMSSRGNYNTFRYNLIWRNGGAGIRLGGDANDDGIGNRVMHNVLWHNAHSALKIMRAPQDTVCGNTVVASSGRVVRGPHAADIEPARPCLPSEDR